jgi:hypothetical protein
MICAGSAPGALAPRPGCRTTVGGRDGGGRAPVVLKWFADESVAERVVDRFEA